MTRLLLVLIAALALPACGFHLRNSLVLPSDLGPVQVIAPDPYSPLAEAVSQALARSGAVTSVDDKPVAGSGADDAGVATLRIQTERWGDTPVSVDARGRAQEYSLRYAVVFDFRRADGAQFVPPQTIELSRDYLTPPVDSTGTNSERELLAREMRREMVSAILRRIDVVSKAPQPAESETSSP